MRIQFEIKERLPEIIHEIFTSEKWQSDVTEEQNGLRRVVIKDLMYDSKANIEIWENEIHIKTAWSNYTYRIFTQGNSVLCEYIGAYRGLLEQNLLPQLTPVKNILDTTVLDSSILGNKKETLRNYSSVNAQMKQGNPDIQSKEHTKIFHRDHHPTVVYDEFIKEGLLLPSPGVTVKE
ncbi:MAG: hypothetical protein LUG51_05685 [Tannerellaceae bacterium]|nr:hypothetical protein [Tannerellaceae bacterium]